MPSMSPRTQQMQMASGAGVDQAAQMFEQGFSQMAYNVLLSKLPDVVQDVVTFKVLDTDLDTGTAVGAFVLMRNDQPLYVPVVLSDNNLKPMELVYHKALNIFLPLSKQWLDELDKTALTSLGKGIKTPDTLYTDVDIRNVVVPPITGRFSYAEYVENPKAFDRAAVVAQLEKIAEEPSYLADFLDKAPNHVKTAFTRVLEKNPQLLKTAAAIYGVQPLINALRLKQEKVAAKQQFGGGLWIADKDTTPADFRRIWGDQAGEAYAGVRKKGFAAKDERLNRNMAVQEQPYAEYIEPNQPGIYCLYSSKGEEKPALVVNNPIDLFASGSRYGRKPIEHAAIDPSRGHSNDYLAVMANGDFLQCSKLVGRTSVVDEIAGGALHKHLFKDIAGEPRQGLGFFVRSKGTTIQATAPLRIKSVTTDSEGTRRIAAETSGGWDEKEIVTQPNHPYGTIWMPKGANCVYLPPDFIWVPLKEQLKRGDFYTSALDLARCAVSALQAVGARKVAIKNASAGQFSIDGAFAQDFVPTLKKLAQDFVLPVDVAEALLEKAASERRVEVWIASTMKLAKAQTLLEKHAADDDDKKKSDSKPKKKEAPAAENAGAGAENTGDPNDPAAQAAMMAAAQPPAPPPPSPVELAAMEFQQHIDSEVRKLQEQAAMLQALTQRSQEIASGAPPMPSVQTQAMGAPPAMGMSTGMSAPPPGVGAAPMPGMAQPGMQQDPSMMGGMAQPGMPQDPSAMGGMAPPGMQQDPSMMGGMGAPQAGAPMDPSMMGAAPGGALPMSPDAGGMSGADPSMAQPPMAMMGADGPSANALEQQINPQFLQQAGQLGSADIFDAAAVSSLAQSPAVKELVAQYLPNLEKALDNLGRVLLTLWMQETTLKGEIGEATFADLEDNLRSTLKSLGDLVLKLSQGSHAMRGPSEREQA